MTADRGRASNAFWRMCSKFDEEKSTTSADPNARVNAASGERSSPACLIPCSVWANTEWTMCRACSEIGGSCSR